ncbi:acyl carrier protein [Chitinophagaceae bacterium LWZ2-11]
MININNVETTIKQILTDKLGLDEKQLTDQASFTGNLGVDSLDVIEVIMEVEKEFDIKIPDEDAESLTTVGALVNYVSHQIK